MKIWLVQEENCCGHYEVESIHTDEASATERAESLPAAYVDEWVLDDE